MVVQALFCLGLTYQTQFDTTSMPQGLKNYFQTAKAFYNYVKESPETRLMVTSRGLVTIKKHEEGLVLPKDIDFNIGKVNINTSVNKDLELMKSKQYTNSM